MAAGKYDAEVVYLTTAIGAAFSGKIKEALEANPYRKATKGPPTQEELERKQKADFDLIGVALRQVAQKHGKRRV